jgi:DMSO/TMAO reductase YedYZ molybdopterin-dependent catalytic subunit
LHVLGAVSSLLVLTWSHHIDGFEQVEDTSDFHCATKWSRMDTHSGGVRLGDVIAAADNPSCDKGWIGSRAGEDSTQGGAR